MEHEYNGWTNRETWLVNLWMTNDEYDYRTARGLNATHLEAYVTDKIIDSHIDGFMLDLLNASLCHVNWQEISESISAE